MSVVQPEPLPQDLHIHTTFSFDDGAIVPEQTVPVVAFANHARVRGISDHFEYICGNRFDKYRETVLAHGFHLGTEITWLDSADKALEIPDFEYYIFHCEDSKAHYKALERLIASGKPVIVAHPMILKTNLDKVPPGCYIEINNRYVWRNPWRKLLTPYVNRFPFVIGSDAHQPHWLNQNIARGVAVALGVEETLLFPS